MALGVLLPLAAAAGAEARVLATVEEALAQAFPGCTVERDTVYLTDEQRRRGEELAGESLHSAIVHPYAASCDGRPSGTAYFDAHRVRTLPETLMVVVDPDGEIARIEVLSFSEPPDYLPREAWYEQFEGRPLADDLALKRGIRPVTGATLTAVATTAAARRVLAVHRVLAEAAAADRSGEAPRPDTGARPPETGTRAPETPR